MHLALGFIYCETHSQQARWNNSLHTYHATHILVTSELKFIFCWAGYHIHPHKRPDVLVGNIPTHTGAIDQKLSLLAPHTHVMSLTLGPLVGSNSFFVGPDITYTLLKDPT
jgi:hypothetical protein